MTEAMMSATPDEMEETVRKAKLLVKNQINKELETIKEEQWKITQRKGDELIAAGVNRKSDLYPRASIHPRAYARWDRAYPGCWQDEHFFDEYLRDNPEADLRAYIKSKSNALSDKYFVVKKINNE